MWRWQQPSPPVQVSAEKLNPAALKVPSSTAARPAYRSVASEPSAVGQQLGGAGFPACGPRGARRSAYRSVASEPSAVGHQLGGAGFPACGPRGARRPAYRRPARPHCASCRRAVSAREKPRLAQRWSGGIGFQPVGNAGRDAPRTGPWPLNPLRSASNSVAQAFQPAGHAGRDAPPTGPWSLSPLRSASNSVAQAFQPAAASVPLKSASTGL